MAWQCVSAPGSGVISTVGNIYAGAPIFSRAVVALTYRVSDGMFLVAHSGARIGKSTDNLDTLTAVVSGVNGSTALPNDLFWSESLSLFVLALVDTGNSLLTSPDGITWTTRLTGVTIARVTEGAGVLVAVGSDGVIYTSADAVTWTARTSGVATNLNSVAWSSAHSVFIAVGASGVILTSPDGITWTTRNTGTAGYAAVAVSPTRILVAASGALIYSDDGGVTWTVPTVSGIASWVGSVHYIASASLFVLIGSDKQSTYTSPDGITWTSRYSVASANNVNSQAYFYESPTKYFPGLGKFVAAGDIAVMSSDGITWEPHTGVKQGDLLVAFISFRDTAAFTVPSGWTQIAQMNSGNVSTSASTAIASAIMAYCVVGSSLPNGTFTRTGGNAAYSYVAAYRGVDAASPLGQFSATTQAANTNVASTPGFTTTTADELLVAAYAGADNTAITTGIVAATDPTTASSFSAYGNIGLPASIPSSWTLRFTATTTSGADTAIAFADALKSTAGSTGTISTTTSPSTRHAFIAASFKMAAGSTVPTITSVSMSALTSNSGLASIGLSF